MLVPGEFSDTRPHTLVEISREQVEEMLRAYVVAKFQIPATPLHGIALTVFKDRFVVRVIDPPRNPTS